MPTDLRRRKSPRTALVSVRCTPAERETWIRLAIARRVSLADLVRRGLDAACRSYGCLCAPGAPPCPKCRPADPAPTRQEGAPTGTTA